jgi:peptidoglycan hydrolase CwlO-like protein
MKRDHETSIEEWRYKIEEEAKKSASFEAILKDNEDSINSLRVELENLESQIKSNEHIITARSEEIRALRERNHQLIQDNESLKNQIDAISAAFQGKSNNSASSSEVIAADIDLVSNIIKTQADIDKANHAIAKLEEEKSMAVEKMNTMAIELETLSKQMKSLNSERSDLLDKIDLYSKIATEWETERTNKDEEISKLRQVNKDHTSSIDNLSNQVELLQGQLSDEMEANQSRLDDIEALSGELDEAQGNVSRRVFICIIQSTIELSVMHLGEHMQYNTLTTLRIYIILS